MQKKVNLADGARIFVLNQFIIRPVKQTSLSGVPHNNLHTLIWVKHEAIGVI
jgi:hypothetical protein